MRKKYRAVIYCRAASQDDSGNTLEKQSARLRGLAKLSNITVVGEVFEYGNGIARQRPGWNKALEIAAEKEANAIFVTDYSRICKRHVTDLRYRTHSYGSHKYIDNRHHERAYRDCERQSAARVSDVVSKIYHSVRAEGGRLHDRYSRNKAA